MQSDTLEAKHDGKTLAAIELAQVSNTVVMAFTVVNLPERYERGEYVDRGDTPLYVKSLHHPKLCDTIVYVIGDNRGKDYSVASRKCDGDVCAEIYYRKAHESLTAFCRDLERMAAEEAEEDAEPELVSVALKHSSEACHNLESTEWLDVNDSPVVTDGSSASLMPCKPGFRGFTSEDERWPEGMYSDTPLLFVAEDGRWRHGRCRHRYVPGKGVTIPVWADRAWFDVAAIRRWLKEREGDDE